jgi:hypothetical protein
MDKQNQELPLIGLLKAPAEVREDVLRTFGDTEEDAVKFAVRWAWDNRRIKAMSQAVAATHLGMPNSHFTNILNRKKYLPPHKINAFEWLMGVRAVSQTIERFRLIRERELVEGMGRVIAENMIRRA